MIVGVYVLLAIATVIAYHADANDLEWPSLIWIGGSIVGTWGA